MHLASFIASALLFPSVFARGRGGGGGGGGGGGTSTISYTDQECYTGSLTPYHTIGNETGGHHFNATKISASNWYWIWDDQQNKSTANAITTMQPAISWNMEVLDAYYNGTFSLTITPPASNSSFNCPELKSQTIPDAFLRIGPQSRKNITRKSYGDENSFYFQFGRTIPDEKCPYTANKAFVNFESSNDNLEHGQAWTLHQKKNGDKFELDGSLTSPFASYGNYWNYVVNITGSDINYPRSCPQLFSLKTLTASTGAKMNATVTASSADMTFSFQDSKHPGYIITGSFSGQHWATGPHIVFDKDTIETEGETVHIQPRKPREVKGLLDHYGKYIIIGVVVLAVLIVGFVLWKCFSCIAGCFSCCCTCAARKKNKKVEEASHQNAWN